MLGVVVPPLINVGLVKVIATVTVTVLDFLLVAQIIALVTLIQEQIAAITQVLKKEIMKFLCKSENDFL